MTRKIVTLLLLATSLFGLAQTKEDLDKLVKQRDMRRAEGATVIPVYLDLFKTGPSVELFNRLGGEYLKQNKPIQAAEFFNRALELDPKSDAAKAGVQTADKVWKEKEALLNKYAEKEKQEKKQKYVCSRAAVMFHLGYMGDAIDMVVEAQKHYKDATELQGMEATFKAGIAVESLLIRTILRDFFQAIEAKDQVKALTNLAEYQFFSLGTGDPSKMVVKIGETFKTDLDIKKVEATLGTKGA